MVCIEGLQGCSAWEILRSEGDSSDDRPDCPGHSVRKCMTWAIMATLVTSSTPAKAQNPDKIHNPRLIQTSRMVGTSMSLSNGPRN